ncbi:MAG: hypothetical protein HOO86_07075 [Bacteroidales bacterium]|nr:hypothetical protein [Bacteroidales bacterium]
MEKMIESFKNRISKDFKESQIDWKVIISFIPIAFITYLFHESGHWIFGELMGNDMKLGLNYCAPRNGSFIKESHALWSAIGGPAFTIIQALLSMFIVQKTKSIYAYSIGFFAAFSRFFSIVFGGINLQDESGIATMLDANKYLVAMIVLLILFLIIWRCNRIMRLNMKAVGYFTVLGTFAILIVIGVNQLIMK